MWGGLYGPRRLYPKRLCCWQRVARSIVLIDVHASRFAFILAEGMQSAAPGSAQRCIETSNYGGRCGVRRGAIQLCGVGCTMKCVIDEKVCPVSSFRKRKRAAEKTYRAYKIWVVFSRKIVLFVLAFVLYREFC